MLWRLQTSAIYAQIRPSISCAINSARPFVLNTKCKYIWEYVFAILNRRYATGILLPPFPWVVTHGTGENPRKGDNPRTASRVMSANRAKDSGPEMILRKALCHSGLRGYRLHRRISTASVSDRGASTRHLSLVTRHSVRPDISYIGKKLAIFVHGCFWHRCPKCAYKDPKTNSEFWQATVVGLPQHWRVLTPEFARSVARVMSANRAWSFNSCEFV